MSGFDARKDEIVNKYIEDTLEQKVARLTNNSQMLDNETNWHRGYIASCRDFSIFYNGELKKKTSEG